MRSLNKVQLIGNLTRDPELRYTPQGTAVCTFSVATNRQWTTDQGEKKEDAEFHRVVAWSKLAEICSQMLSKGTRVYVEGRLQTRNWIGQDGNERTTTEIVASDMITLTSRSEGGDSMDVPSDLESQGQSTTPESQQVSDQDSTSTTEKKEDNKSSKKDEKAESSTEDDIPF